jgi:GLPGLI family protein
MRIIIFILLVCLFSPKAGAQSIYPPLPRNVSNVTTVDSGNIRILYALNATDIKNPATYDDLQRLEIGGQLSKYYSDFLYRVDSLGGDRDGIVKRKSPEEWSEYVYSEYFKDFFHSVLTEYVRMPWGISNYQSSEEIPAQNWELYDDTLTVLGYLCQKATCKFRGRNYTAWFAVDIPINNGPWKFGGLPGLILKVYDADKLYVFESTGIENHIKKYPVNKYNSYTNYGKTDREKLSKLLKKIHKDYITTAGIKNLSNNINPKTNKKSPPYNPLELE